MPPLCGCILILRRFSLQCKYRSFQCWWENKRMELPFHFTPSMPLSLQSGKVRFVWFCKLRFPSRSHSFSNFSKLRRKIFSGTCYRHFEELRLSKLDCYGKTPGNAAKWWPTRGKWIWSVGWRDALKRTKLAILVRSVKYIFHFCKVPLPLKLCCTLIFFWATKFQEVHGR